MSTPVFKKPLILCLGNICRSPVAEAIFKRYLEAYYPSCHVISAGMSALVGASADPHSIAVAKEHGYDLQGHIAQQLTYEHMREHDLILVMEEIQQRHLEVDFPFARGKIHRLGKFRHLNITDPYQKSRYAFEEMFKTVYDASMDWLSQFWPIPSTPAQPPQ